MAGKSLIFVLGLVPAIFAIVLAGTGCTMAYRAVVPKTSFHGALTIVDSEENRQIALQAAHEVLKGDLDHLMIWGEPRVFDGEIEYEVTDGTNYVTVTVTSIKRVVVTSRL